MEQSANSKNKFQHAQLTDFQQRCQEWGKDNHFNKLSLED
jgi:hypothetical protein